MLLLVGMVVSCPGRMADPIMDLAGQAFDGLGQFGVLLQQLLDPPGVLVGVKRQFRGDLVGPLGGDEENRPLQASHHRKHQIQKDVRVGIESVFAVAAAQVETRLRIAHTAIVEMKRMTKGHEPMPLRTLSAARSPSVSWSPDRTPGCRCQRVAHAMRVLPSPHVSQFAPMMARSDTDVALRG